MAIIRVTKKTENYSVISNVFLNDKNLSFQCKGLLAYLLTKPNNWNINVKHLVTTSTDGRDTIYKSIDQLIKAGYIVREQGKSNGKFKTFDYNVFELPMSPLPENPDAAVPDTGSPDTETPDTNKYSGEINTDGNNMPNESAFKKQKTKTIFQRVVDIYDKWYKKKFELAPKYDGVAGKAAKAIIKYFRVLVTDKEKNLTEVEIEDRICQAFQLILDYWPNYDKFKQDQTKLVEINSNIQNLVKEFKNGRQNNGHSKSGSSSTADSVEALLSGIVHDGTGN